MQPKASEFTEQAYLGQTGWTLPENPIVKSISMFHSKEGLF